MEEVTVSVQLPNTDIVGFIKIGYGDEITIQIAKTALASELKRVFLSDQARSLTVDLRPNFHAATARNVDKPLVHNHGSEEGEGLDCRETTTLEGSLKGACMTEAVLKFNPKPRGVPLKFNGLTIGRAEVNDAGDVIAWVDSKYSNLFADKPLGSFSIDTKEQ
jgi:hypothetical protein